MKCTLKLFINVAMLTAEQMYLKHLLFIAAHRCNGMKDCNTTRKAPSINQCFSNCDLWPAADHKVLGETCNYLH
jgi:hypothetical protein